MGDLVVGLTLVGDLANLPKLASFLCRCYAETPEGEGFIFAKFCAKLTKKMSEFRDHYSKGQEATILAFIHACVVFGPGFQVDTHGFTKDGEVVLTHLWGRNQHPTVNKNDQKLGSAGRSCHWGSGLRS